MSFDTMRTDFGFSREYPVATGQAIGEEAMLLVSVPEDGVEKVQPSTGVAGERCVGYAITAKTGIATRPWVEDFVVPLGAPLQFQLRLEGTLILTNVRVRDLDAGPAADLTVVVPPAVPAAGQVLANPNGLLVFNAAEAGHRMRCWFNYNLTVEAARRDRYSPGVRAINNEDLNDIFESITVGQGTVRLYTTQYDAQVDWDTAFAAGTVPQLGADGRVTLGGVGTALPNGAIIKVPTPEDPHLGVRFNAPA